MSNSHEALGHFEAEVTHTFLPGCRNCGGSHPLARKGALDPDVCPDCGEPAGTPGQPHVSEAALGGTPPLASAFLRVGNWLNSIAKKV